MKEPTLIYNPNSKSKVLLDSETGCWANKWFSYWPVRYACIFLTCLSFVIFFIRYYSIHHDSHTSRQPVEPSWDFLLFTQSYPLTCCIWWDVQENTQSCNLAQDEDAWTVHGIWPTKTNTEGPFNCHKIPFNYTAVESIKSELEKHWPSIGSEKNDLDFWEHEWKKHGTCAIEDSNFDSELTYFKLGLKWNQEWQLASILRKSGVIPSNSRAYSRSQFHDAVKSFLGKAPYLDCYYYEDLNIYLINEIRLCVSKELELADCDTFYPTDKGTCPSDGIFYPASLNIRNSHIKN